MVKSDLYMMVHNAGAVPRRSKILPRKTHTAYAAKNSSRKTKPDSHNNAADTLSVLRAFFLPAHNRLYIGDKR
jgi:hypothetical protein